MLLKWVCSLSSQVESDKVMSIFRFCLFKFLMKFAVSLLFLKVRISFIVPFVALQRLITLRSLLCFTEYSCLFFLFFKDFYSM